MNFILGKCYCLVCKHSAVSTWWCGISGPIDTSRSVTQTSRHCANCQLRSLSPCFKTCPHCIVVFLGMMSQWTIGGPLYTNIIWSSLMFQLLTNQNELCLTCILLDKNIRTGALLIIQDKLLTWESLKVINSWCTHLCNDPTKIVCNDMIWSAFLIFFVIRPVCNDLTDIFCNDLIDVIFNEFIDTLCNDLIDILCNDLIDILFNEFIDTLCNDLINILCNDLINILCNDLIDILCNDLINILCND